MVNMTKELALKDKRRQTWVEFEWLDDDLDIEAEDSHGDIVRVSLNPAQARELWNYLKAKLESQSKMAGEAIMCKCGHSDKLHRPLGCEWCVCRVLAPS